MKEYPYRRTSRPDAYGIRARDLARYGGIALGLIVLTAVVFVWFVCRIDVGEARFVPLLKKTGARISNEDILAPTIEFRGPQFEFLREGRHFRNPYVWEYKLEDLTVIPAGNPATWEWIHSLDKRRREQVRAGTRLLERRRDVQVKGNERAQPGPLRDGADPSVSISCRESGDEIGRASCRERV